MELINDADLVEFIDESGDKLFCLRAPKNAAFGLRDELVVKEASRYSNLLKGFDFEKIPAAKDKSKQEDFSTPAMREFMFKAVAVKMIIGAKTITEQEKLVEAYQNLNVKSGKWIDEKVKEIWDKSEISEKEKK